MNTLLVPILWSLIAGACFGVGIVHFATWLRHRARHASLALSFMSVSVVCLAVLELAMMRASSPDEYVTIQRWMHVPLFTTVVSMVVFVRAYFRAGRLWLAWAVCVSRALALVLNFVVDGNLEYSVITALREVELLGTAVAVPVGVLNPWVRIGELSSLLLFAFVLDAVIAAARRDAGRERQRALVIGGSIILTLVIAVGNTLLLHAGVVHSIYLYTVPFAIVVVALGVDLSADVVLSEGLAGQLVQRDAELRRSERRMDDAAEAAGIGIWEWDIARDRVWMTDRCRALFGFDATERIDFARFLSALHPEDREVARLAVARSRTQGGSFEREYRVVLAGGGQRWVHTRGGVDLDGSGLAVLMRGVSFDVTRRKEAEDRFRLVVEAAANGLVMLNPDGVIALANERAEMIFGYSRQQLVGSPIAMLIPGGVHGIAGEGGPSSAASPEATSPAVREVLGRRSDGTDVPLEVRLTPIRVTEGTGLLASIVDVSERKASEALVQRERAFLRQVIDINPNLIFAKDREGRFTLANKSVADLYGTTVEDLIGRTDADFNASAEEVESFRKMDLEVMDTLKERFIAEEHITDAAGRGHVLQTVKRPILGEDGKARQVLGVATDITARKEAELELGRQRNELAHLTRVLLVSELSGSIAHELNQPLAAILSNAQAAIHLMDKPSPDHGEVREILNDIVEDDKRAGQVIQGLRLLLKKGERRREPVNVEDLVIEVLRLLRSDLLNAGVTVAAESAPALPPALGDPVQLQQVLLNLIVNGCDAMAALAPAARLLAVSSALEDGFIRVNVSDRGPGIAAEHASRVFEPFFTTKDHGLGLGLAVCRNIIEAHGGRLWARDNPGPGTTFSFTVPVFRAQRP